MAIDSDAALSQGDLMRRMRELEQSVQQLQTARRLESASIGSGGLRVKDGGRIQILDDAGGVAMDLAAEGLTLQGILEVLGRFDFRDGNGFRRIRIKAEADGDEGNLSYRSGPDALEGGEVVWGTVFVGEQRDVSHGFLVQQLDGQDVFRCWSGENNQIQMRYFNADHGAMFVVDDDGDDRFVLNSPDGVNMLWIDADGLRRPRLPVSWVVGQQGDTVNDSSPLRGCAEGYPVRTYPTMRFTYRVTILEGSPTVRVRLRDTVEDEVIMPFQTHTSTGYFTQDLTLLGGFQSTHLHRLEAEVTSGTGEVRVTAMRGTVGFFGD